jgi:hypothetical protein
MLNKTVYVEGTSVQEHIKLLCTRKAAVDNLRSIPPTPQWLPVIPSLYALSTSAEIMSSLLAHGMILDRGNEGKPTSSRMRPYSSRALRHVPTRIAKQRNVPLTPQLIVIGLVVRKKGSSLQTLVNGRGRMLRSLMSKKYPNTSYSLLGHSPKISLLGMRLKSLSIQMLLLPRSLPVASNRFEVSGKRLQPSWIQEQVIQCLCRRTILSSTAPLLCVLVIQQRL